MFKYFGIAISFFLIILVIIGNILFYKNLLYKSKKIVKIPITNTYINLIPTPTISMSPISLEEIFKKNHTFTSKLPKDKTITLIATGDIIPARSVNFQTVTRNNFLWPYEKTIDLLKTGDIVFVNFESPLVDNCPVTNEGMVFCGDKRNVEGLVYSGVNVANLANNHSTNYGEEGLKSTIETLNKSGILTTGISGPVFKEVKGIKFAFLGYDDVEPKSSMISIADEKKIKEEIASAKKKSDVVITAFHWGDEYTSQPNKREVELAHLAIDSGADLIIGNHPHWIQALEIYKGKLIMYAHGNFVFDQMWSENTELGVVGRYTFYGKDLIDAEYFPIKIQNYGQPYLLEGIEKEKVLNSLKEETNRLKI